MCVSKNYYEECEEIAEQFYDEIYFEVCDGEVMMKEDYSYVGMYLGTLKLVYHIKGLTFYEITRALNKYANHFRLGIPNTFHLKSTIAFTPTREAIYYVDLIRDDYDGTNDAKEVLK
jgi:hypothetical protein